MEDGTSGYIGRGGKYLGKILGVCEAVRWQGNPWAWFSDGPDTNASRLLSSIGVRRRDQFNSRCSGNQESSFGDNHRIFFSTVSTLIAISQYSKVQGHFSCLINMIPCSC